MIKDDDKEYENEKEILEENKYEYQLKSWLTEVNFE
jgi:hypothetical protein